MEKHSKHDMRCPMLAVALGAAFAMPAFAQQASTPVAPQQRTVEEQKTMPPVRDPAFARLDADGDGRISPVEADRDSAFGVRFDDIDTDEDGQVSGAEYTAFQGGASQVDASQGGGAMPQAATAAAGSDAFADLDADRDGRVSSTEADGNAGFDAGFASMDANADGFVTNDEYRAHARTNAKP